MVEQTGATFSGNVVSVNERQSSGDSNLLVLMSGSTTLLNVSPSQVCLGFRGRHVFVRCNMATLMATSSDEHSRTGATSGWPVCGVWRRYSACWRLEEQHAADSHHWQRQHHWQHQRTLVMWLLLPKARRQIHAACVVTRLLLLAVRRCAIRHSGLHNRCGG